MARKGEERMVSIRHEKVYHVSSGHAKLKAKKTAEFFAHRIRRQSYQEQLSSSACMLLPGLLKSSSLIALMIDPHGKNDPDPDIGQCSYRYRVAFAFGSLAE